jgi:3',5'-cyclic AMP phosphodiesterase CpdA
MNIIENKKFIASSLIVIIISILFSGTFWYFQKYDTRDYEHKGFFPLPILRPIWERKVETSQILKIGIITDTHVHPNRINRSNTADDAPRVLRAKNLIPLQKFNAQMEKFNPDTIVHLGDIIDGTHELDVVGTMGVKLVAEELKKSDVPVYWLAGNHDLRSITKEQFRQALQIDDINQVVDVDDYRLIFLDASYYDEGGDITPEENYVPGYLPPRNLIWLEEKLQTEKRVFIFMHQSPFSLDMWREKIITSRPIKNAPELNKLVEKYNVEAIFNGHIETKFYGEKNGVEYYSLVGTKKNDLYPQSYYELTINSANPQVKMYYTEVGNSEVEGENDEEKSINFK